VVVEAPQEIGSGGLITAAEVAADDGRRRHDGGWQQRRLGDTRKTAAVTIEGNADRHAANSADHRGDTEDRRYLTAGHCRETLAGLQRLAAADGKR
jgi:hypothetical protein